MDECSGIVDIVDIVGVAGFTEELNALPPSVWFKVTVLSTTSPYRDLKE